MELETHVYVVTVYHGADFDKMLARAAFVTRERAEVMGSVMLNDYRRAEAEEWRNAIRAEIDAIPFGG